MQAAVTVLMHGEFAQNDTSYKIVCVLLSLSIVPNDAYSKMLIFHTVEQTFMQLQSY